MLANFCSISFRSNMEGTTMTASPHPSPAPRAPGHRAGPPTGLPTPQPYAGAAQIHVPAPPDPLPELTLDDLYAMLTDRRAAVHQEIADLIAAGEPIAVPADAVFLCELLGLVVDLHTGVICAYEDEYVTPRMPLSDLRKIIDAGA